MTTFNAVLLVHTLEKSSNTPQGRILSLFDILHNTLMLTVIPIDVSSISLENQALLDFLTSQAKILKAFHPTILAQHIILIAHNAAQQEIDHRGCGSLLHAKTAANALILAQTQKDWHGLEKLLAKLKVKPVSYPIVASLFAISAVAMHLPALLQHNATIVTNQASSANLVKANIATSHVKYTALTAGEAASMYAKYEQMRSGTCQFPEVLQIPDKDRAVYLENVVGGKIPTNLKDLAIANAYLEKVRCNYTPMLMANSK